VELLPLQNPSTGRSFSKVIRSTAFLDRFTPPAVPGQSPQLVVEFAAQEDPLIILTTQGVQAMPEPTQVESKVDVSELQKVKDTLTELQAKLDKAEAERAKVVELAMQKEQEKDAKITELQTKQDAADAEKTISELKRMRTFGDRSYITSPAFIEVVSPVLTGGIVQELQGRENMAKVLDAIVELAGKNALLVPLTMQGNMAFEAPENKPKDKAAMIQELMTTENLSEADAWVRVTDQLGDYK